MNLFGGAAVQRLPLHRRPKGVDIDRPEGVGKLLLRRALRRQLRLNMELATAKELA